jgi:FAD/FMN-containing dehydrogenase
MALEPKVLFFKEKSWSNWHRTLVKQPISGRIEVHNPETNPNFTGMRKTAAAIQGVIADAVAAKVRLHAVGGRWSHSEVASPSPGRLLETAMLNWRFRPAADQVSPAFKGKAEELVLVQGGIAISEINKWLETGLGRSFRTTGSSNGQTIVGAMTTSSHGSALDMGALHSQVCGLQLLTGTKNLWLERSDDPVASDKLVADLGATRPQGPSDDLFEAALVSLGGLGIVHAVMLRTAPIFRMSANQVRLPYDDALKRAITDFDFSGVALPGGQERPYYFRAIVNPHDKRGVAYVQVMYQRPFPPGTKIDYSIDGAFGPGHDVVGLVAGLLDTVPGLTGALTEVMVDDRLKLYTDRLGTWGETFDYSTPRKDGAASSMAIPQALAVRALELATDVYKQEGPAPLVYTLRFVRRTPGLLAWQQNDRNCVFEIDGLNSKRVRKVMEAVRARFDQEGIPYAQHWGKLHGLTEERVKRSFGPKLDRWRKARETLLPTLQERRTFATDLMEKIGLGA